MSILIRAVTNSGPDQFRRHQHVTMTFSDALAGESLGTADFTVFPFASTIEAFESHSESGSLASQLVSEMTTENFGEARVLYYDPDVCGSGSLERFHAPASRAGEVLRAIRRSFYGELATITVTRPELLVGMTLDDAEAALSSAGFRRFEESRVWASSSYVPED